MKQTFTILLFLIIGGATFSQRDSTRGKQFRLTGKLIHKPQLPPHCGVIASGTVIEFEVIKLSGMSYPKKTIGIIITCPRDYAERFFEKGKIYQLVFSDKNQAGFGWVIPNNDLLKKNGLSFDPYALEVKKMP